LHDAVIGERLGKPSVGIMTTMFVSAADLMARILGAENYAYVTIGHPVSSADEDTLKAWAKEAAADSERILIDKSG